ncbi:MAG: caspase family protein [Sulfurimonas sp.]
MKNIIIIFFILTNITLQAQNLRDIVKTEGVEKRVALVIGNSDYTSLTHLKNPLNDARLMQKTLEKSGFKVIYKENAKIRDMKKLLRKFAYKIRKGGIGFYYFAGHSVNVDGKNYLIGVDALLDNRDYISHEAIPLNNIIKKMNDAHNRLNVLISDTCRNTIAVNSFHHNHFGRGVGKGLLALPNTKDIFLAYSTASGEIVRDGKKGSNGILTKYFVQNLKKESATIKDIFTNTKKDVYAHTDSKSNPSAYNQILKDFFFVIPTKKQIK